MRRSKGSDKRSPEESLVKDSRFHWLVPDCVPLNELCVSETVQLEKPSFDESCHSSSSTKCRFQLNQKWPIPSVDKLSCPPVVIMSV